MSNDTRNKCGTTLASACVIYTGPDLTQVDQEALPCNPNVNDILKQLDSSISTIKTAVDVSGINVSCLDNCVCGDLTIKQLFELLTEHVCNLETQVKD